MFTGLVETIGIVMAVAEEPPGRRLAIRATLAGDPVQLGDSIAVNGCCLTVVAIDDSLVSFEAGPETLSRTNLGALSAGHEVNIERALRAGDRIGGHFVTGHIDAVGHLKSRMTEGGWETLWFETPREIMTQLVSKGSIAVDGVSLTIVQTIADGFSVQLIPHTLAATTLGKLQLDGAVNLETDLLAKHVQKQLEAFAAKARP